MSEDRRSEMFSRFVAQQPDNELFRFSLAQALESEHRFLDAVEHYKYCVHKKSDWMMPRLLLGKLYFQLGKKPEGRVLLQDALRLAVAQQHAGPESELRALLANLT
jgi:predicted Zn-dependent protease